ncbi:ATP-dependent DNA/RNA helicase DHX36 [Anastrepha ludens]|uniref:ATP-dependent DNA/RNA helicase DHX36 n=1 Tax=Anastrepha ludens TaxID=28586 RepID=UPI0023B17F27|nr:ATP-dependent DNA/RNA helicase DHX36 [Anastrepha ludens]XP_053956983.1 ATP-dependent DNA/RNA helicase DHX36 [Anastrepha ludens]XP_053956984.1 ATP-dependent DNA/RNA helicase DHX36 [Anastrepha ludens]
MDRNDRERIRHPPGLRGRDIGLFYRNLSKRKRPRPDEPTIRLGPCVSVPQAVLARVEEKLYRFAQSCEDENVLKDFEAQFRHLLFADFEDFIVTSKSSSYELLDNEFQNQRYKSDALLKERDPQFQRRYEQRMNLPAMKQHDRILEAIKENQVLLIVGSTGCGKTTQVPQLILDDYIFNNRGSQCHVVCTQPRRISAVTVAERVAYERCEHLGTSVGYQIRLESEMPRDIGSILYCTTGVLLQKLQSDPLMNAVSIVIIDEIHERSVETDLLMALLKIILPHRPNLKIILMSATVSEEEFSAYFNNCYTINIEGTMFPVKVNYLEDIIQETGFTRFHNNPHECTKNKARHRSKQSNRQSTNNLEYSAMIEPYLRQIKDKYDNQVLQSLRCTDSEGCENLQFLEHLIFYICDTKPPGAILVFLPGYDNISKLNSVLLNPTLPIGQRYARKIQVYPLHSMMPTVFQKNVFQSPPPGIRKVILSTTVAETSVTIDDVVYVINSGRMKTNNYNVEANLQTLEEAWVTKANTKQRKGRAGRVQPGICYNLFSRAREKTMLDQIVPEILRSKLESTILNMKMLHVKDVGYFFNTLISPPNQQAVTNGINLLKRINALDVEGTLTPLGMHLARLPVDPPIGKMLVMGALFRCLDPITSVAAGLSFKSPFYTPLGKEREVDRVKRHLSANQRSDHLLIDNVVLTYRESLEDSSERDFCYKNFLNIGILQQLEDMKRQFASLLRASSFTDSSNCNAQSSNENSKNITLLRAIIAAGLYPNMAFLSKVRRTKNHVNAIHHLCTPEERRVNFHPSSVNSHEASFDSHYFVYFQKQKSSSVYILDATMVFPMALIIFGDGVETGYTEKNIFYISVARTYYFKCDPATAKVVLELRKRLEWLMQKRALNPSPILPNSSEDYIIKAIQILLSLDDVYDYSDQYLSSDEEQQ